MKITISGNNTLSTNSESSIIRNNNVIMERDLETCTIKTASKIWKRNIAIEICDNPIIIALYQNFNAAM